MTAGVYDIQIEQGADWEIRFQLKSGDVAQSVTGWMACMEVRPDIGSKTAVLSACDVPQSGDWVVIQFTAAQTASIPIDQKKIMWVNGKQAQQMRYDIEMKSPDGKITRPLQGAANVYPEVTRC